MSYTHIIHNAETGIIEEIPFTDIEIKNYENEQAQYAKEFAIIERETTAKVAARQVILDKLGLTEEEARVLLG